MVRTSSPACSSSPSIAATTGPSRSAGGGSTSPADAPACGAGADATVAVVRRGDPPGPVSERADASVRTPSRRIFSCSTGSCTLLGCRSRARASRRAASSVRPSPSSASRAMRMATLARARLFSREFSSASAYSPSAPR